MPLSALGVARNWSLRMKSLANSRVVQSAWIFLPSGRGHNQAAIFRDIPSVAAGDLAVELEWLGDDRPDGGVRVAGLPLFS